MTSLATDLKVHDVMTRNVVTIPPEDSVEKAARVMVNFARAHSRYPMQPFIYETDGNKLSSVEWF